jgi:hypothetical protein
MNEAVVLIDAPVTTTVAVVVTPKKKRRTIKRQTDIDKPNKTLFNDDDLPITEYVRSGVIAYFDRAVIRSGEKKTSKEFDNSIDPFYPTKRNVFTLAHKQVNCALFGGHDARKAMSKQGIIVDDAMVIEQFNTTQLIGKMALMLRLMHEIPEELQGMEGESKRVVLQFIKHIGKDFTSLAKRYGIDFSSVDEHNISARNLSAFLQEWMAV